MSVNKGQEPKKDSEIDYTGFKKMTKSDFNSLTELVEQNEALSYEKQLNFGDIIGNKSWQLDMSKETITFEDLVFPIQIIGSLSFNNNTWMWAWANTQSGMPENLLVQSNELKKLGEEKDIKELKEGYFEVEDGFEHKLGTIACGLFKSKCYYCANYGQGTLVVTIDSDTIPEIDKDKTEKVITNFPRLIVNSEVNHKNAYKNYLIDREFKLKITGNKIEGLRNDNVIVAEFDEKDRLISINGEIKTAN